MLRTKANARTTKTRTRTRTTWGGRAAGGRLTHSARSGFASSLISLTHLFTHSLTCNLLPLLTLFGPRGRTEAHRGPQSPSEPHKAPLRTHRAPPQCGISKMCIFGPLGPTEVHRGPQNPIELQKASLRTHRAPPQCGISKMCIFFLNVMRTCTPQKKTVRDFYF